MTELSAEARALIARSKQADEPSPADRARLRDKLTPQWAAIAEQERAELSVAQTELAQVQPAAPQLVWTLGALLLMAALGLWVVGRKPSEPAPASTTKPLAAGAQTGLASAASVANVTNAASLPEVTPTTHEDALAVTVREPARTALRASAETRSGSAARASAVGSRGQPAGARLERGARARSETQPKPSATATGRVSAAQAATRPTVPQPSAASAAEKHSQALPSTLEPERAAQPTAAMELDGSAAASARVASAAAPVKTQTAFTPQPIDEELAMLGAAQEALRNQRPSQALRLVEQHAFRFPRGALTQERLVVHTLSLCALQRMSQARQMLSELELRAPGSPIVLRVRKNCGL